MLEEKPCSLRDSRFIYMAGAWLAWLPFARVNDSVDGFLRGTILLVAAERFLLCKHDITMLTQFGLVRLLGNLKMVACPHVRWPQNSG